MPNCSEEFQAKRIDFAHLGRRVVEGRFDGGSMTSDAGVMLLGTTDRKLGLMNASPSRATPCASSTILLTCCASASMDWH
jgi:hypothetical protein